MKNSPYGEKEVRALVNFDPVNESSGEYDKAVPVSYTHLVGEKILIPFSVLIKIFPSFVGRIT